MSVNTDNDGIPRSYSIRSGTVNYGWDYEFKMAALLSLRCIGCKNARSMWLAMNADKCGAFDDVILCLTTTDGKIITYLIQLKHRKNDIKARDFKPGGDLALSKYYDTIVQIKNAIDKKMNGATEIIDHLRLYQDTTVFILYTNSGTTKNDFLKSISKKSTDDVKWLFYQLINTNNGDIFAFDYEKLDFQFLDDVKGFMERFFLFTKQLHVNKLDAAIEATIENIIQPLKLSKKILNEVTQKIILFVTQWSKGELGGHYPLTKKHVRMVLLEHMLMPHIRQLRQPQENCNFQYDLWNKIIEDKPVTIIHMDDIVVRYLNSYIYNEIRHYCESSKNKKLWESRPDLVGKKILRTTTRSKIIKHCGAYECMWKEKELPLVIEVNNSEDYSSVLRLLEVFPEIFNVVVLLDSAIECTSVLQPFKNIKGLNNELQIEILNCPVQLQGRSSVQLSNVMIDELMENFTVRDMIYILSGNFNIGSKFCALPEIFIERSLEKVCLKPQVLQEVFNEIFVIKCPYDFELFLTKYDIKLDDKEICCYKGDDTDCLVKHRVFIVKDDAHMELINRFRFNKTVHYLVLHEENGIEWIRSLGPIKNIARYRKSSGFSTVECYSSDNILKELGDGTYRTLRLISAYPGMGKSILMDYIALHAPTDLWVLRVDLREHVEYYNSKEFKNSHLNPSKHLEYFNNKILLNQKLDNNFNRIVFKKFLHSKKVLVLLDGFDEISVSVQKKASKMIKSLHDSDFGMYLTTRPIMQIYLEELLETFAVTINPFSKMDQIIFLERYFENVLSTDTNKKLIRAYVEKLLDAATRNLNDQDEQFTGVPLQTKLLAEVFTDGCKAFIETDYFENKYFDLVYLYKHFIDQKIKIACSKFGNSPDDMLHHYKQCRSFYALRLLFTPDDLTSLNIEQRLKEVIQFFPDTLHHLQKDGIIVAESESNVTFVHRTFAEYLAAEWLYKNIRGTYAEVVVTLVKKIFHSNFITVRSMFDRKLAKKCSLHLAVINRQVNSFKKIINSNPDSLLIADKGNRSIFHIIAAWGVYHPLHFKSDHEERAFFQMVIKDNVAEMLHMLPNIRIKSTKDNLLDYTELDYAIASSSLNIADDICARLENAKQCISVTGIDYLSQYLLKFQYGSLGSVLIKHSLVKEIHESIHNMENIFAEDDVKITDSSGKTALHWATLKGETNVVSLLLSSDIDKNARDNHGMGALHYSIVVDIENQSEILSLLLKNDTDITRKDNYGKTPLHYALHYNQIEILKLLLNFAGSINSNRFNSQLEYENQASVLEKPFNYLSEVLAIKDADGGTVLHWAAGNGFVDVVSLLLSYGAYVEIQDIGGNTPLHWATVKGHSDIVILLLSRGADINAHDKFHRTPLYVAVEHGQTNIVALLLKKGANVQDEDIVHRTALYQAINNGYEDIVSILLSHGINKETKDHENMSAIHWAASSGRDNFLDLLLTNRTINFVQDVYGRTPLICAAQHGHTSTVNFILNKEVDIGARDNQGLNVLHYASWNGHAEVVKLLLSHGLNLELKDKHERTPLICAAKNGHGVVVTLLLLKGAHIEARDDQGMTALNCAAYNGHIESLNTLIANGGNLESKNKPGSTALINASNNGHVAIVTTLLSKKADKEARDNEGMNGLHCAAFRGYVDTVAALVAEGANLEATSKYKKTALIYAANNGHTDTINLLLFNGASVDAIDNENMTALTWAAHDGHVGAVTVLLDNGASLEVENKYGRTPLLCAAQNGHAEVVKLLMLEKADVEADDNEGATALHHAAYNGHFEIVNELLVKIMNLEKRNEDGRTPLMHAAYNGHTEIVDLLLIKGAAIDAKDNQSMCALHWSSWNGHTDTVKLLLCKGANVEMRDNFGRSPLKYAVLSGQIKTFVELLAKGAEVDAIDNEKMTALHCAASKGWRDAVHILLAIEADIELKDKYGKTALMYAAISGSIDTVNFLLSRNANVGVRDETGLTAADWARRHNHESIVLLFE